MKRWSTLGGWSAWVLVAALAVMGFPNTSRAAAGDPLLDYGADLVTDYVSRGVDLFVSTYSKDATPKEHGVFNTAPAIQPYLTVHGPSGFSIGLWSSWALVDRADDPQTGFQGLRKLDEIDYTLGWDFKNKLGGFGAGYIAYQNPNSSAQFDYNEVYVKWAMPFMASVSPTLTHYVVASVPASSTIVPGSYYTQLGFSGGEAINWKLNIGHSDYLQDITGGIGKSFGSFSVTFNATYRPTPQIVGPYDVNGHYTIIENGVPVEKTYPKVIAWLTFSWAGSVTE